MNKVIQVDNLSKKYTIYHENLGAYSTIVDSLTRSVKKWAKRLLSPLKKSSVNQKTFEEFWALKDISLEIEEGDRIGILGKNGAGKSTLLKILSRIIEPSFGKVKIKGRVSSLLEVGTGFHPELTGRENIFLNGAILGMAKREIGKKFDEIVSFAEIERFVDAPVKYYSSGMYARLGFAIAAHLDPEILIVDEVLAVGDAPFQEKCLNKLDSVSKSGRTILFVSHNTAAILHLCNKGLLLEKGQLIQAGPIEECVNQYVKTYRPQHMHWEGNVGDQIFRIFKVRLISSKSDKSFFYNDETAKLEIEGELLSVCENRIVGFEIKDKRDHVIANSYANHSLAFLDMFQKIGLIRITIDLDIHYFLEGEYLLSLVYSIPNRQTILQNEIQLKFTVYRKPSELPYIDIGNKEGVVLPSVWKATSEIPICHP